MQETNKAARVEKLAATEGEMALINRQSLKELTPEEVFTFRVRACDNQVDRDGERFADEALVEMAGLYVGKPMVVDHRWSAAGQTARVYAAEVETDGDVAYLVVRAYMLRGETADATIAAIEGGIMREVSVGCSVAVVECSVCGENRRKTSCGHKLRATYDDVLCVGILREVSDVYELSFVAVPAQPKSGVVKRYGGEEQPPDEPKPDEAYEMLLAQIELEQIRY